MSFSRRSIALLAASLCAFLFAGAVTAAACDSQKSEKSSGANAQTAKKCKKGYKKVKGKCKKHAAATIKSIDGVIVMVNTASGTFNVHFDYKATGAPVKVNMEATITDGTAQSTGKGSTTLKAKSGSADIQGTLSGAALTGALTGSVSINGIDASSVTVATAS